MTKDEAQKEINRLTSNAQNAIHQAEALADEHGLTIDWSLAYGMGGTYYPKRTMTKEEALELIRTNKVTDENRELVATTLEGNDDAWYGSEVGWMSSSQLC